MSISQDQVKQVLLQLAKRKERAELLDYSDVVPILLDLSVQGRYPISGRAAMTLFELRNQYVDQIQNRTDDLIEALHRAHESCQKDLLMLISVLTCNQKQEAKLFEASLSVWLSVNTIASVRYEAFKALAEIVRKNHTLLEDLQFIIHERYLKNLTPRIEESIIEIWKELQH